MKKTLSLLLAALLLASSMVSCGNGTAKETEKSETKAAETNTAETNAPDTEAVTTDSAETDAPAPVYSYDTSLITENGVAKAHIVIAEGASDKEKLAADELVLHIKKVTGADISVVNAAQSDSLPIIIATPDSLPELEELFPEDLAWLRTTGEVGDLERYGPDGFSIRQLDGKIYIFGANADGALNGVYDFIEENLDVIWIRGNDENGIIYDEMPTVHVVKADYREKSPFVFRYHSGNEPTNTLARRNKYATQSLAGGIHNVKSLLTSSPIYDPDITEYWETNKNGTPMTASSSRQVNYWSELTADTIAARVIQILDKYDDASRPDYYCVSQEDLGFASGVYPAMNEPFEYEPGQFVTPDNEAYISTVYFTFINRVARKVAEKYPDVTINTLAYALSICPPVCDVDDNVSVWFCPYCEDYTQESFEAASGYEPERDVRYFEAWVEKHPNIVLYTYYYTHYIVGWYERPIWYRVQNDMQYYAQRGVLGQRVETTYEESDVIYDWQVYSFDQSMEHKTYYTYDQARKMNQLSYWLFYKLCWNPYEDVDALIVKFCDKVYGAASEHMQEYYRLLTVGWNDGAEYMLTGFNSNLKLTTYPIDYFNNFLDVEVDGVHVLTAMQEALAKAWEAADDRAKEHIEYIKYACDNAEELILG